ncbi:MAG TPA: hypothetical protein EYH15_02090 [Methanothermococcus okinawensis]|uniref:Uncharacterized protein n=1 Tax=Methanothermococcus okinawensis TaxID=155863 RepID=A0A832ZBB2_9EURY|nr:hypothetical protein [Methanothermococcus okinawensis]
MSIKGLLLTEGLLYSFRAKIVFPKPVPPKWGGDRDYITILNMRKKTLIDGGSLITPTAPQMKDVAPNRWGEPMILLCGGEGVR